MLFNRRLLALARDVRWHIVTGTLLGLAIVATRITQALLVAHAIARMFAGADVGDLAGPAVWLAVTIVVRAVLIWLQEQTSQWIANQTKIRLRERLYRRLAELGPGYLIQNRTGEIRAAMVDGVESLETYFGRYLPALGQTLIGPVAVLIYLLTLDPLIVVIVFGAAVVTVTVPVLWQAAFKKGSARVWEELGTMDADFVDTIQGLPTLKAFNAAGRRREHLDAQAERVRQVSMGQLHYILMSAGVQRLGTLGGFAGALIYAATTFAGGGLPPESLIAIVFLVPEAFRPLDQLSSLIHDAFGAVTAAEGIDRLLEAAAPVVEASVAGAPVAEASSAAPAGQVSPSIAFDQVSFTYPGRDDAALDDVTLSVGRGDTVAVVGPSGSGKTTLISLLLRFFDPQSGTVRLGDTDIRQLPREHLYRMVAVVSQDTYLFHGSVGENIALGRPDAGFAEIQAAAVAAGVDGFVAELPDGYDTPVGERGLTLSGGQRQRVAIARALLNDAPILVLDEATSSVDAASEAAIQATLDTLARERTTLVIAHRLSTIRAADRIVVLEKGRVAETGEHETLSRNGGVYAALTNAQNIMTG